MSVHGAGVDVGVVVFVVDDVDGFVVSFVDDVVDFGFVEVVGTGQVTSEQRLPGKCVPCL